MAAGAAGRPAADPTQSFCFMACQQQKASRPPGRAVRRLMKAATGSSKNITPKRKTAGRSRPPQRCGGGVRLQEIETRPAAGMGACALRRATSSMGAEMSTPIPVSLTEALCQHQALLPPPQPTSSACLQPAGAA